MVRAPGVPTDLRYRQRQLAERSGDNCPARRHGSTDPQVWHYYPRGVVLRAAVESAKNSTPTLVNSNVAPPPRHGPLAICHQGSILAANIPVTFAAVTSQRLGSRRMTATFQAPLGFGTV